MKRNFIVGFAIVALSFSAVACKKKVVAKATQPTPAPVAAVTTAAPTPAPRQEATRPQETATAPRDRMPDAATRARIQDLLDRIEDAYFDYDKKTLRPDAEAALKGDVGTLAEIIKQYPDFKLTVEGHCDERGSDEYNLALGEARAKKSAEYMASLGLPSGQLKVTSYGRQKPVCSEQTEACWQKNRRAHLTQAQSGSL